jgi:transposase
MKDAYQLSKINKSLQRIKEPEIRERLLLLKRYYTGDTLRGVADEHQCTHGKVRYWKVRYQREGLHGLRTKEKSGAPRKLKEEQAKEIKREILQKTRKEGGWSSKQIREYIREASGVTYTIQHTIRIAQEWGLAAITARPHYGYAKEADKRAFLKEKR